MNIFRRILGNSDEGKDGNKTASDADELKQTSGEQDDASMESIHDTNPNPILAGEAKSHDEASDISTEKIDQKKDFTPIEEDDDDDFVIIPSSVTRPLPSEPVITNRDDGKHLDFGQATDVGMVRTNNQDASFSYFAIANSVDDRPDFGLFIVADGMGGHHDGEKASAVTIREVATSMIRDIYLPMLVIGNNNDADRPTIAEALTTAIKKANESVIKNVPDGGTTITAMVVLGNLAHIGHVGDSRAYVINKQGVEQITRDHSLVQRLIELDQLTPEEAADHHQRNVLYRAIGQSEDLEVDTLTRRLQAGAKVLICSDGLWGLIDDNEIQQIVLRNDNAQVACQELIEVANANGGHDNITAIIISMP